MKQRIKLPAPVAAIYRAVEELEAAYPLRKFTPDGHLVGSIGEVIAAEALSLTLHPASYPGHDAFDGNGNVQIKMNGHCGQLSPLFRLSFCHGRRTILDNPDEASRQNLLSLWSSSRCNALAAARRARLQFV